MASPVSCPLKLEAGYRSPNPHLCPQTAPTPPVNGKQVREASHDGLIPAGAGQTPAPTSDATARWAHPRRCGADLNPDASMVYQRGSSPRVRGRLVSFLGVAAPVGLIPAGAGQTTCADSQRSRSWAHPRGCAADNSSASGSAGNSGSSPRVRGRPPGLQPHRAGRGLIPAGAGQTWAGGYSCPA